MKLSILVPTMPQRKAFWPWLSWNINKQREINWVETEIIYALDPTAGRVLDVQGQNGPVLRFIEGHSLADKRNKLLEAATGELVCWFDDDDWHHPLRLKTQIDRLKWCNEMVPGSTIGTVYAGRWFYHLYTARTMCLTSRMNPTTPVSFVGYRAAVQGTEFPEIAIGEVSRWLEAIQLIGGVQPVSFGAPTLREPKTTPWVETYAPLLVGVQHGCNSTSDFFTKHPDGLHWELGADVLRKRVGSGAWGDTDEQFEALKERIRAG